ncbi:hypothetical protein BIW11_01737 [Tropilaelaps mercedesae]|uniref:Uncharacterized protein n=1 Tax=Tropilaelaps mercedesae TaxID=418985 RepID=A0A1V9X9C4_9ACAR|nr:hypothetical protein BIW11_01737 [Tropilaelaps mercedesae]
MSLLLNAHIGDLDHSNDSAETNVGVSSPSENSLLVNNVLHSKDNLLEAVSLITKLGSLLKKIVLKSRFVHFSDSVDNMCTMLIKAILQHSSSLQHLHLEGIPLQNKAFIELLRQSHLKTLILDSNGLDCDILSNLDMYLKGDLEELRIEKNTIRGASVKAVAKLLGQCTLLKKLSLRSSSLQSAAMEKILSTISSLTGLCELNLFDNDVGQNSHLLTNSLEKFTNLVTVNLGACSLTDSAAVAFVTKFQRLRVEYVNFSSNLISKEGCSDILKAIRGSKIKTFVLWGNPFCVAENSAYIIRQVEVLVAEYNIKTRLIWKRHDRPERMGEIRRRLDWSEIEVFMNKPTLEMFIKIRNVPEKTFLYLRNFQQASVKCLVNLLFTILKFYCDFHDQIEHRSSMIAPNFLKQDVVSMCELVLFCCLTPILSKRATEEDLILEITSRLTASTTPSEGTKGNLPATRLLCKISEQKWVPQKLRLELAEIERKKLSIPQRRSVPLM